MTIHDIQVFYVGMLSVNGVSNIAFNKKTESLKKVAFTSRPDTFEPSVINSFSDLMKEKFSEKELMRLSKKTPETKQNAEILANTKLSGENILDNLFYNRSAKVDAKKIADKVNELDKLCSENLSEIKLSVNKYDNSVFDITAINKDRSKKTVTLDEDFKTRSIVDVTNQQIKGKIYEIKKSKDFKNNVTSEVRSEVLNGKKIPVSEIIVTKDYKEFSEQSPIKGIFNTKRIYNNGKVEQISSGTVDEKNGIKTVKKDAESLDGTKTHYEFSEDIKGNRIVDYKITDKNGKILYKKSEAFEVIDENTFISSKNDNSYEIKYSNDDKKLNIKNCNTNEENEIDLHMYMFGDSKKLIPTLKKISGDELIKMGNNVTRLFQIDDDTASYYHPGRKDINTCDNEYIFLHELGHAKDMKNYDTTTFKTKDATEGTLISAQKNVLDVYGKEKELFNKNFSNAQREHIDYFMNTCGHSSGTNGAMKEALAEVNAILNTYNTVDRYSMRAEYLQRYFPKTIATLAEML
ncbi:hypothetical protein IJ843_06640 [bacterium]|nr:hypothetical protein [bacterium]